jgi:hypothetical protein
MNLRNACNAVHNHTKQRLRAQSGRAIAQAVSCRLPTTVARLRSQVRSCGICGEQSGAGAGFLLALRFPLPILNPPTASHTSSIIRGWYNRLNSGLRAKGTHSHPTPRGEKEDDELPQTSSLISGLWVPKMAINMFLKFSLLLHMQKPVILARNH